MLLFALLQRLFAYVSLAILGTAGWLIWSWWDRERDAQLLGVDDPSNERLYWGLGLLAFSLLGRFVMLLLLGGGGSSARGDERGEGREVAGADGAKLWVEEAGATTGPILVFTHGWGMSTRIWAEARAALKDRFGLVFWDLPGAGRSGRPRAGYSLEGFAEDLHAVIDSLPADRPIVLVGHSIGGMTVQTLCARHPELLNRRVAGIVLENTTHLNPLRTMILSGPFTALQPLIEADMKLATVLSPLLWAINWQSYLSGSTHLAMRLAGFGSRPTREQLDRASLLPTKTSPAVQSRGNLAMIRWSVTEALPRIDAPALVFVGGRDLVTKDHAGEHIAAALPQARLMRIEDAGHMGPVERHATYNAAIAEFALEVGHTPAASGFPATRVA
jgi:pimeloyl-ACP methyl ester carboxylesterase